MKKICTIFAFSSLLLNSTALANQPSCNDFIPEARVWQSIVEGRELPRAVFYFETDANIEDVRVTVTEFSGANCNEGNIGLKKIEHCLFIDVPWTWENDLSSCDINLSIGGQDHQFSSIFVERNDI